MERTDWSAGQWDEFLSRLARVEQAAWEATLDLGNVSGMRPSALRLQKAVAICRELGERLERRGSGRRYREAVYQAQRRATA